MAVRPWHLLTLCDGYGGTELALRSVARVRTVCRVERDAYAAAVLVARMGEARLDQAPVWDDLCTFDGTAWRGRVDIVAAGFPCQPFSAAGQRAGTDDERWLWPSIATIIADVGPSWVLLENVGQLVRHGLPEVLSDLALYGFDAQWGLYTAAAVGAPHRRERVWIVAHADHQRRQDAGSTTGEPARWGTATAGGCPDVGDAGSPRRPEISRGPSGDEGTDGWQPHGGDLVDGASETVADTAGARRVKRIDGTFIVGFSPDVEAVRADDVADTAGVDEREPHHQECTIARCHPRADIGRGGFPPGPDDLDGWEQWIAQGGPQPTVRRSTDGPPLGLADALHLGGNGLVPQCAAQAWAQLAHRLDKGLTA